MTLLTDAKDLHAYYLADTSKTPDIVWGGEKECSFTIYKDNVIVKQYTPTETGLTFHQDRELVQLLFGCVGSAKSTTVMAHIVKLACEMPACNDGIRRMRAVLIRNSMPDLKTSTLKTWEEWFDDLGIVKKRKDSPYFYEHRFTDKNGIVELEVYFLSGDEQPKKLDKFLSTEFTVAYMNEASSLPEILLDRLITRIGRYPSASSCSSKYYSAILMDTNPPSERHWIYKIFEVKKPERYKIYKTPPALLDDSENPGKYIVNIKADNIQNLPGDYYTNMALKGDHAHIRVVAMGEYGVIREGQPVYDCYNDNIHSIDDIVIDWSEPLYIGHDYGLTPCSVICQFIEGQLRAIQEFVSPFNTSVLELAEMRLMPWLQDQFVIANKKFNDLVIYSVGDPSDPLGSAVKMSPSMVLNSVGLPTIDAPTNKIAPRIQAVKFFMNRLVNGKPAYLISKRGCPILRESHIAEYRYKKINTVTGEKLEEVPDKTHPFSDIEDAQQYVALLCTSSYYEQITEPMDGLMRKHGAVLSYR